MLRILILGANGLLGSNLYFELERDHTVFGTFFNNKVGDLLFCSLDAGQVEQICLKNDIEVVINCIGLTNIELCEHFPEKAWQINARWVHQLGEFCNNAQIKLIHISTDHFSSILNEIRDENCIMYPINQYGYTKFAAEKICSYFVPNSLILRVNFVATNRFGLADNSLLTFFIKQLRNGKEVVGFHDVNFSPVSAKYVSEVINVLLENDAKGLFNVSASDPISKFNFAKSLAKFLGYGDDKIKPGSIIDLPKLTNRPSNLSLDATKLSSYIKLPSIEQVIDEALELANIS